MIRCERPHIGARGVRYSLAVSSRGLVYPAVAAVAGLVMLTACSSGSGGSTGLQTALGHIADISGNRSQIWYDNTSELVKLAGANPASSKGFAPLRGIGTGDLASFAADLPGQTAVKVFGEDYAISAGSPPSNLTLISGGQDAGQTASDLTRLGWAKQGGRLVAPSPASASGGRSTVTLALEMAQVSDGSGQDLTIGGRGADLGQAGSPSGKTLAQDPVISALAGCLGNVVAASIASYSGSHPAPSEVATGVVTPSGNSSGPQVVTCAAWPTSAAASAYRRNLGQALRSGESYSRGERFARLLTHASVHSAGGPEHIVSWQAGTPGDAELVFQLAESEDLPALPNCQRLPPTVLHLVPGCT
jgi:hypothetical protein